MKVFTDMEHNWTKTEIEVYQILQRVGPSKSAGAMELAQSIAKDPSGIRRALQTLFKLGYLSRSPYSQYEGYTYSINSDRTPKDLEFSYIRFKLGDNEDLPLSSLYEYLYNQAAKPEWDSCLDVMNKVLVTMLGHMVYRAHLRNEEWVPIKPSGLSCRRILTEARRFLQAQLDILEQLDAVPIWEENNASLDKALISEESLDIDTAKARSEEFRQIMADYDDLLTLLMEKLNEGPTSS
jgi:hypothetical protein